jgi:2-phospho-L-lactate/phosphoenolpyruvate guanylyltransferase
MPGVTTAILIGLKHLENAKSRLAPELSAQGRRVLMRQMLARVAAAALAADLGPVVLVSSDADAPALAAQLGIAHRDDGDLPWNPGLAHALAALDPQPDAVLYLAGDLPRLTAEELHVMAAQATPRSAVIARAHDGGTNALLLTPATALLPNFGEPSSAEVHSTRAEAAGLTALTVDLPGLALDVDTAQDARRAGLLDEEVALGLADQLPR